MADQNNKLGAPVPDAILDAIRVYGDERADDKATSSVRMAEVILALRRHYRAAPAVPAVDALTRYDTSELLKYDGHGNHSRDGSFYMADEVDALLATPSTVPDEQKQADSSLVMPPTRGTDSQRRALYEAALDCHHKITEQTISLFRNPTLEGNALSQLADRLELAVASGAARGRHARNKEGSDFAHPADAGAVAVEQAIPADLENMLAQLRTARDQASGELRAIYNQVCDRMDVLISKGASSLPVARQPASNKAADDSYQQDCHSAGHIEKVLARQPQVAIELPTNDEVYAEVCRERGKSNLYVSTNAVNDVMAAVRKLAIQAAPEATSEQPLRSIAGNPDAMIILTQGYPTEAVVRVVDAHVRRQVRAAIAATSEQMGDAQVAMTDQAKECLMDVVSHHGDFHMACSTARDLHKRGGDDDSARYWDKQLHVLARMKVQAERALAAPATERAAAPADLPVFVYFKEVHAGWPEFNKQNEFSDGGTGDALVKLTDVQAILAANRAAEGEATSERKPLTDALCAQIMNLPCKPDNGWPAGEQHAYKLGHRDARHAVAELVGDIEQHHGIGSDK